MVSPEMPAPTTMTLPCIGSAARARTVGPNGPDQRLDVLDRRAGQDPVAEIEHVSRKSSPPGPAPRGPAPRSSRGRPAARRGPGCPAARTGPRAAPRRGPAACASRRPRTSAPHSRISSNRCAEFEREVDQRHSRRSQPRPAPGARTAGRTRGTPRGPAARPRCRRAGSPGRRRDLGDQVAAGDLGQLLQQPVGRRAGRRRAGA